ncbi:MAG TPA: hypothetical protein VKZ53_06035 [Candidatus Angelobacter sp.]|nr:hypothetical protein [Candidatus Angelobacter sp.]
MTSQEKLRLDPNTIIVSTKGCLHVLNRRGSTKVQADQIDVVHEKLKGYLDGNYQEDELISALPAEKQPILEKYFTAMSQAGALHRGGAGEAAEMTVLEDGRSLIVTLQNKKISVFLDGDGTDSHVTEDHSHDACLRFVTPQQMDAHWKHIWRSRKHGPHLLYVVEQDERANIEERKKYALWLLGCSRMDCWEERRIRLYTLDRTAPALRCFFQTYLFRDNQSKKSDTSENAARKSFAPELVTATDEDQLPLVSAQATVPFYSSSVAGCGLEYSLLCEDLEREFMVQTVLDSEVQTKDNEAQGEAEAERFSCVAELKDWQHPASKLQRTRVDRRQASRWPVAGSLLHLRLRALERYWWMLPENQNGSGDNVNLLERVEKGNPHPQIAYLADVLRTRRHVLDATIHTTACGLHVCQSGTHIAYSLVKAKAIRDVLLAVIKDEFHRESLSGVEIKHECDFGSFLSKEESQQLIVRQSALLDERRVNRRFTFKHVRRFGISAWIGELGPLVHEINGNHESSRS